MTPPIDHALLDAYERSGGDPSRLPQGHPWTMERWELLEGLLLDLHLVRHDYADEVYARHVDRELERQCAGPDVVQRIKAMRS